jgi:tetratricopeptide (TPR) repeat protein
MTQNPADSLVAAAERALRAGAYDQAIAGLEAYLETHPADTEALALAGHALRHFNRNDRVAELYARAMASGSADGEVAAGYVESLIAHSRLEEAREVAEAAIAAHPEVGRLRLLYAHTDLALGNPDAARATFWEQLTKDPDNADCVYHLAQIVPEDELPRLRKEVDRMWAQRKARDPWDAATLGYAYGRIAERMKEYELAWEGFSFGAQNKRSIIQYDEATVARTPELHTQLFDNSKPFHDKKEQPGAGFVFIVSLPRSGSTLIEQILDAHPQVEAIGERPLAYDAVTYWHRTFGPSVPNLFTLETVRAVRKHYVEGARALVAREDSVIVDKSITNYVFLGFLRTILPGARFIHAVRHPLDTAISCYTTLLFSGNEWTYDLAEIGRQVRRYEKTMKTWMSRWPDEILTVRYEDLVADPETLSREVVEFCGLPWDPACLNFHESDRPILTASVNQVRQPIYKSALGRATRYESHLGPLLAAMGRRAADPDWFQPKDGA